LFAVVATFEARRMIRRVDREHDGERDEGEQFPVLAQPVDQSPLVGTAIRDRRARRHRC
jgi:hypothetical protein